VSVALYFVVTEGLWFRGLPYSVLRSAIGLTLCWDGFSPSPARREPFEGLRVTGAGSKGKTRRCDEPFKARHTGCVYRAYNRRLMIARYARPAPNEQGEAHDLVVFVPGERTECGVNLLLSSRRSEPIRLSEPALSKRSASNGVAQGKPPAGMANVWSLSIPRGIVTDRRERRNGSTVLTTGLSFRWNAVRRMFFFPQPRFCTTLVGIPDHPWCTSGCVGFSVNS